MEIYKKIVELEKHFLSRIEKELTILQYKEYMEMFKNLDSKLEKINGTGEHYNNSVINYLSEQNFHDKVIVCLFNCLKDKEIIKKHLTLYFELLYSLSEKMCLKVYNNMILGNHIKNQYGERIDKIIKNCLTLSLIIKDYILEYNPSEEVTKQLKKFSEEVNK